MMVDKIENEQKIIENGVGAVGEPHRLLAIGPHADRQATPCVRPHNRCVVVGPPVDTTLAPGVAFGPYDVTELWRYNTPTPEDQFEVAAVDRAYPPLLLFSILTSVAPLLVADGIIILHAYSDFQDDDPYRHQNQSLNVVSSFLQVHPDFSRRTLAGQVVELSRCRANAR